MRRRSRRVHERRVALHFLEHLLVFLARLDRRDAERHDLKAAQVAPLSGEHLVERVRQLHRVAGERRVADAHFGDLGKRGLQRGQKLGLELAIEAVARVVLAHVAADVRVEQDRIADAIAVLAEAADGNVDVDARALVNNAERHRRRRAVLVADELLGVEVVDALILGRLAAEGEALADIFEGADDACAELTGENGGLRRAVVHELARHGAQLRDLALIDDDHALSVRHRDDGAVRDDVFASLCVAAASGNAPLALDRHHVFRDRFTVKILLPLVGQYAASRAKRRFDKAHCRSSFVFMSVPMGKPPFPQPSYHIRRKKSIKGSVFRSIVVSSF